MARITQQRERVEVVQHELAFDYVGETGCGFAFDCDADGNVDAGALNPIARSSYEACLTGSVDGHPVQAGTMRTHEHSYIEPALLECDCGAEVALHGFTNTCHCCGADYNGSGHRLADRSQWGEETGEHWTECV